MTLKEMSQITRKQKKSTEELKNQKGVDIYNLNEIVRLSETIMRVVKEVRFDYKKIYKYLQSKNYPQGDCVSKMIEDYCYTLDSVAMFFIQLGTSFYDYENQLETSNESGCENGR